MGTRDHTHGQFSIKALLADDVEVMWSLRSLHLLLAFAALAAAHPILEDMDLDLRFGWEWLCRDLCRGRIFCFLCPMTTVASSSSAPPTTAMPAAGPASSTVSASSASPSSSASP